MTERTAPHRPVRSLESGHGRSVRHQFYPLAEIRKRVFYMAGHVRSLEPLDVETARPSFFKPKYRIFRRTPSCVRNELTR